jgi:hypothetical protein
MPLNQSFIDSFNKFIVGLGGKSLTNAEDIAVLESILRGIIRSVKKEVLKELKKETKPEKTELEKRGFFGTKNGKITWGQQEEDQRQVLIKTLKEYRQKIPESRKEEFESFIKINRLTIYPDTLLSKLRIIEQEVVLWFKKNGIR